MDLVPSGRAVAYLVDLYIDREWVEAEFDVSDHNDALAAAKQWTAERVKEAITEGQSIRDSRRLSSASWKRRADFALTAKSPAHSGLENGPTPWNLVTYVLARLSLQ